MISITREGEFLASIDQWFGAVRKAAAKASVSMAYSALEYAAMTGPQFSGDFVANLKLAIGAPSLEFEEGAVAPSIRYGDKYQAYQQGSGPARQYAEAEAQGRLSTFKLGQSIFLSSNAQHDEAYSWKIENNEIVFRPENFSGGRVMSRTLDFLHRRRSASFTGTRAILAGRQTFSSASNSGNRW